MKKSICNFTCALVFLIGAVLPALSQNPGNGSIGGNGTIEGRWLGVIEISGGIKLRLILKVSKNSGAYQAKIDSIDQGGKDLPVDSITQDNKNVKFASATLKFSYEGVLNERGDEITGTVHHGATSEPLSFRYVTGEIGTKRAQEPQKPYPYKEEEVSYQNVKDNIKLAGTLTLPRDGTSGGGAAGKYPAVVLITGSGSQDRDETIPGGHHPFLVLADYLTRRGIAVLRVDDRGIGGSERGDPSATTETYVGDVLSGVEYLKSRQEIEPGKIGLIGHSEGGAIAPLAAVRSNDVAFIVMLAGFGQTGADVILTQIGLLTRASGAPPETVASAVDLQSHLFAIIKSEPDNQKAAQKIDEMLLAREAAMSGDERQSFAAAKAQIRAGLPMLLSPWYRYFLAFDPRPTLEKVRVPVLALDGDNDIQVAPKENLDLIAAALKKGGNQDYTIKSFPKLNHFFQTSVTGMPSEYAEIEETMAPQVLETVSDWILKRVR